MIKSPKLEIFQFKEVVAWCVQIF